MIKLYNVSKQYSSDVKIGEIDLEIPKAGITSIIGPNGAGKSTTLLMIGRLLKMDEGEITVSGLDVVNTKPDELAKNLAILRQENHFVTKLTVRQLVGFGRYPYTKGRLTKEDEEIITKYIDFLGLSDLEHRFIDQLSGGQRQMAYVAMVLSQETEVVLLDEPLNNLDVARSVQMLRYLRKAADELNRTIVMVLHDINFAARYSDRIICMKQGRVCNFGCIQEIMQSDLLSETFDTDIEVIEGPDGPLAIY
ncbi:MAG TPA: ATP-binding cassette domain-containing protein [Erysipelothrix sp.]|jgi:iron complex transport system ATP-binding protein|nr:ATP-binding cassette domain-containing protein [Erysipelothrix sp.]